MIIMKITNWQKRPTSFAGRRHKGRWLSIASATILAGRSCASYCNFRELRCRQIDAQTGVCSCSVSPLFVGECKQSYGTRKAQEDFNECQPCLEIYGRGGECILAGSANATWRGIRKESHRQNGNSKGYQEDYLLKAKENI